MGSTMRECPGCGCGFTGQGTDYKGEAYCSTYCTRPLELQDELTRLRTELAEAKAQLEQVTEERDNFAKSAAFCEEHKPTGGARSHCLACACTELSAAISLIDYNLGEPNEYECSLYDTDCDEDRVARKSKTIYGQLATATRKVEVLTEGLKKSVQRTHPLSDEGMRARDTIARADAVGKEDRNADDAG